MQGEDQYMVYVYCDSRYISDMHIVGTCDQLDTAMTIVLRLTKEGYNTQHHNFSLTHTKILDLPLLPISYEEDIRVEEEIISKLEDPIIKEQRLTILEKEHKTKDRSRYLANRKRYQDKIESLKQEFNLPHWCHRIGIIKIPFFIKNIPRTQI